MCGKLERGKEYEDGFFTGCILGAAQVLTTSGLLDREFEVTKGVWT